MRFLITDVGEHCGMSSSGHTGLVLWLLGGFAAIGLSFGSWAAITIVDLSERVATLESKLDGVDTLMTYKFNADRELMAHKLNVVSRDIENRDLLLAGKLNAGNEHLNNQIGLIVDMIEMNRDVILEHEHSTISTKKRSEE